MYSEILNEAAILDILEEITFETIGCTEPIAIALAVATAYKEISGDVKSISVTLDKNVYKNVMAVGIPGTNLKGIKTAIALGLYGDQKKGLLLLENIKEEDVINSKKIIARDIIKINLNERARSLNIEVEIQTTNGKAKTIIAECHSNIVFIEKNGDVVFRKVIDTRKESSCLDYYDFSNFQIDELINIINKISEQKLEYLLKGFEINKKAAEVGLTKFSGMGLGVGYQRLIAQGMLDGGFISRLKMITSAAVDARMGGSKLPVFGCVGSGNHGIMFFLAVGMCFGNFGSKYSISLAHVFAFGLVVLVAIKQKLGLLSPLCGGAIAAGTAAAAAITYMLGGDSVQITNAINLLLGNIAGMVCDGAKYGCALKISTGAACAVESALLAINGTSIPVSDGIIGRNFIETITNMSLLNSIGMREVDKTILEILKNKNFA